MLSLLFWFLVTMTEPQPQQYRRPAAAREERHENTRSGRARNDEHAIRFDDAQVQDP